MNKDARRVVKTEKEILELINTPLTEEEIEGSIIVYDGTNLPKELKESLSKGDLPVFIKKRKY